jgi:hypothetical protein
MFNLKTIIKTILILILLFLMLDTGKRALTDEGFIELMNPSSQRLLEKFGLLKLKDSHGLNKLYQSAEKFLKEHLLLQTELTKDILFRGLVLSVRACQCNRR